MDSLRKPRTSGDDTTSAVLTTLRQERPEPDDLSIDNLWSVEALGIRPTELENDEDRAIELFRRSARVENGRFIVRWPWKVENPYIPSNYRVAAARLKALLGGTDANILRQYDDTLLEQEKAGIIERVENHSSPYLTHYIPHRHLIKGDKMRIVYDASAKASNGLALNDLMYKGPKLLEDLVALVVNFRLNEVGITADIEKAFLQVGLHEVDRDAVRFLWVKDPSKKLERENLVIFRFSRVPFGVIASPFLLNIVLKELLGMEPCHNWHRFASNKFYVDNFVASVRTSHDATRLKDALIAKLKAINFNLRDWTSNDRQFLLTIPENLRHQHSGVVSVLGLLWHVEEDVLTIKLNSELEIFHTKRAILQFLASIFDPAGFCSPCTLSLKLLLRDCWQGRSDWDDSLDAEKTTRWLKLRNEACNIGKIKIQRRYCKIQFEKVDLHVFCDASKDAYACVAYLAFRDVGEQFSETKLIFSKTRVAPLAGKLKKIDSSTSTSEKSSKSEWSIPRLELMAVLIGVRIIKYIRKNLAAKIRKSFLWSDATTTLQWLHSRSVLPIFVENRIREIRQTPEITIRYVPTENNPADIASRGMTPTELEKNSLWWYGPPWLPYEHLWPPTPPTTEIFITGTSSTVLLTATTPPIYRGLLTDALERRFEYWSSLVRTFAHILRARGIWKKDNTKNLPFSEMYLRAEVFLLKELQKKHVSEKKSSQITLFRDNEIIRCRGRMQNVSFPWDTKHPILLPRASPAVRSIIHEIHKRNCHIGVAHTLSKLREKFWVPKGRALVKSVIHSCKNCQRWSGGSYTLPPMPPLPTIRVAQAAPFTYVGVDYFGPLVARADCNQTIEVHVALFTCLVTRAIHLELVRNKSAYEFLLTFNRFTALRRVPKIVISDNALNFRFVQPLLSGQAEITDPKMQQLTAHNGIEWRFIPAYSPWYGGAYERLVALVKNCLRKTYGNKLLDITEFSTYLYLIADILNGRPLTYISSDDVITPLKPNHFLRANPEYVEPGIFIDPATVSANTLIQGWKDIQHLTNSFWCIFRNHYLQSLREKHVASHRHVRGSVKFVPKVGDVVLIQHPNARRGLWHLGKIVSLDSRGALAKVLSEGRITEKTVNRLYPMEVAVRTTEEQPESSSSTDDHAYARN